jgi:hypothetical protein
MAAVDCSRDTTVECRTPRRCSPRSLCHWRSRVAWYRHRQGCEGDNSRGVVDVANTVHRIAQGVHVQHVAFDPFHRGDQCFRIGPVVPEDPLHDRPIAATAVERSYRPACRTFQQHVRAHDARGASDQMHAAKVNRWTERTRLSLAAFEKAHH